MCTMTATWCMVPKIQSALDRMFCHFGPSFCPPPPSLTAQKMKITKKWKKQLEISSIYSSVLKIMIIGYTVPQIWRMTDVIDVILGYFCPFTPVTAQKMNILKKLNTWWYHHFTLVYQNSWSYAVLFLRYGMWQM